MSVASHDYFAKARAWAATGLFVAGVLLVVGSLLDWVSVGTLPEFIPADQQPFAEPFNGLDVKDGYITAGAGVLLALCAVVIVLRPSRRATWTAVLASVIAGTVAISDYRDISGLFEEFGGIGRGISPGIGITLAAAGALLGLIASVATLAATPREDHR